MANQPTPTPSTFIAFWVQKKRLPQHCCNRFDPPSPVGTISEFHLLLYASIIRCNHQFCLTVLIFSDIDPASYSDLQNYVHKGKQPFFIHHLNHCIFLRHNLILKSLSIMDFLGSCYIVCFQSFWPSFSRTACVAGLGKTITNLINGPISYNGVCKTATSFARFCFLLNQSMKPTKRYNGKSNPNICVPLNS